MATDFPTRVGMARLTTPLAKIGTGFPHPRGDGPFTSVDTTTNIMISPPAWGWPVSYGFLEDAASDFPTRVGMARNSGSAQVNIVRFPHPRGDGPARHINRRGRCVISPPAWGWPGQQADPARNRSDFPTRVGMAR